MAAGSTPIRWEILFALFYHGIVAVSDKLLFRINFEWYERHKNAPLNSLTKTVYPIACLHY